MTKLAILSTVKYLKYSMKYTDFRRGALDTHNLLRMYNLHHIPVFAKCHQSCVFDESVNFCKLVS